MLPTRVDSFPANVKEIAQSVSHTLFLLENGQIWSVGQNVFGQLGRLPTGGTLSDPGIVNAGGVTFMSIGAGLIHSAAVAVNGDVYTWGRGGNGRLCFASGDLSAPTKILGEFKAKKIAACIQNTWFISATTGQLFACGANTAGQLGVGTLDDVTTPTYVSTILGATDIVASGNSVVRALVTNVANQTFTLPGQLSLNFYSPNPVYALGGITDAVHASSVTFFQQGSKIFGSGAVAGGLLGPAHTTFDGTTVTPGALFLPSQSKVTFPVSSLAVTGSQTFYLSDTGTIYGTGTQTGNKLGFSGVDISPNTVLFPRGVTIPETVLCMATSPSISIAATTNSSCISSCSNIWIWGDVIITEWNRVFGVGAQVSPKLWFTLPVTVKKISMSSYHALFLDHLGNVWSFGSNDFGYSGVPVIVALQLPSTYYTVPVTSPTRLNNTSVVGISTTLTNPIVYPTLPTGQRNLASSYMIIPDVISKTFLVSNGTVMNQTVYINVTANTTINRCYSFGSNYYGALGLGNGIANWTFVPTLIDSLISKNVSLVLGGHDNVWFVDFDGFIYFAGVNANGVAGLGTPGSTTEIWWVPLLHPYLKNVISVSSSSQQSVVLTSCPAGKSGINCDVPVCYGVSGRSQDVCSGQGKCVDVDKCVCGESSSGDRCEVNIYYWKPQVTIGEWTNKLNWLVKQGNQFAEAIGYPSNGDAVYFVQSLGSVDQITVTLSGTTSVTVYALYLGSNQIIPTLILDGAELKIQKILQATPASKFIFTRGATFNLGPGISWNLTQPLSMTDSTIIGGTMFVPSSVAMTAIGSSFQGTSITNYGSLQFTSSLTRSSTWNSLSLVTYGPCVISGPGSISLSKSTMRIASGEMNISTALVFSETTLTIDPGTRLVQTGKITASLNAAQSTIINQGVYLVDTNTTDAAIGVSLINQNLFQISGNGSTLLSKSFVPTSGSTFILQNSNLEVDGALNISAGLFYPSGKIKSSNVYVSSVEGYFRLNHPKRLVVLGDLTLTNAATVILTLNGTSLSNNDYIEVNGTFSMQSFCLVRLGNSYKPGIGTQLHWLNARSAQVTSETFLFGLPFKNVAFDFNNGQGVFSITLSFGVAASKGYACNYIHKQRVLESNLYDNQNKMMISLTTPIRRDTWIGFGFDFNGTLSSSLLVMALGEDIVQYNHNLSVINPSFLDAQAVQSPSIFQIAYSPDYYTINILVPLSYLKTQKRIYYAEISNSTVSNRSISHYFDDPQDFVILDQRISPEYECTNFLQPIRVEVKHPAPLAIVLVLYIVLFIICVIFGRFRPLNTRGLSPYLTIFFLFTQLILEIRNYSEIPYFHGSLCFYYSYGTYPLQIICFVLSFLYFLRYFLIINLNEYKNTVYKQLIVGKSVEKFQQTRLRILKVLSSGWLAIALVVTSYLLVVFIYTIILAGFSFKCRFATLITLKSFQSVILIIVYCATILAFAIDVIGNYRIIFRCKWVDYIFNSDPYFFRVQMLLYLFFMVFSVVVEIIGLAFSDYLMIAKNIDFTMSLNTIVYFVLILINVMFPLVITIIYYLKTLGSKSQSGNLNQLMADPATSKMFVDFCTKEFSLENITCWMDILKYRNMDKNDPAYAAYALTIFEKYLNGESSVMEVNVQKKFCQEVIHKIKSQQLDSELFCDIEGELRTNLYDTFSRFKNTSKYIHYLKSKTTELDMIEGKGRAKTFVGNAQ